MRPFFLLFGGAALLFFGMERLTRHSAAMLSLLPAGKGKAELFLTGFLWSAAAQSSSVVVTALTAMSDAGLLRPLVCLPVLLGANVGTTAAVWMLSGLRYASSALLLPVLAAGSLLLRRRRPGAANVLLDLVPILGGVKLLGAAAAPLAAAAPRFQAPVKAFFLSCGLTALAQSSALTLRLAQEAKGLSIYAAAAIVIGANVGTCSTGLLASLTRGRGGKQTALLNLALNLIGAVLFLPLCALLPRRVSAPEDFAALHTLFNAWNALLLLPLTPRLQTKRTKRPRAEFSYFEKNFQNLSKKKKDT